MKPLRYYGNKIVLSVKIQMKKIVWKIVTDYRWNKIRSENWPISSKMENYGKFHRNGGFQIPMEMGSGQNGKGNIG